MRNARQSNLDRPRRKGLALGPLLMGAVLTAGYYSGLAALELPRDYTIVRYTTGHWILNATVVLFFWGMSTLVVKAFGLGRERAALRYDWIGSHGPPVPANQATSLLDELQSAPGRLRNTCMGQRLLAAVRDVQGKQASEHIEEHLKYLAELDDEESYSSYALCRVIAWMIPILGFLGTVVGITMAIAMITPEQLESSLPQVTAGLSVAFDTTALSLALSMILIFCMFLVERSERNILRAIERRVRWLLGNRFLPSSPASTPYLSAVHAASEQVIGHTRSLIERQSQLWSQAMEELHHRMDQKFAQRESTFADAMQSIAEQWQRDSQTIVRTQNQMDEMANRLTRIAELLVQRAGEEKALISAQDRLADNLRMLRQTQSFDEALHSLTAAVHLLTVRVRSATEHPANATEPDQASRDRRVA